MYQGLCLRLYLGKSISCIFQTRYPRSSLFRLGMGCNALTIIDKVTCLRYVRTKGMSLVVKE